MKQNRSSFLFITLIIMVLACNLPNTTPLEIETTPVPIEPVAPAGEVVPITPTVSVAHIISPSTSPGLGLYIYDVESSGTASEKRAPDGDSYDINRLERPFLQDMTYVPDLDIVKANLGQDADWFYISIDLVGTDPNHAPGINYGVEVDMDRDGFGDYIIWAAPPYTSNWDAANVRIFKDNNHDTSGVASNKSDAPITTDGYETLVFNGGAGDADPDMAWARLGSGEYALQIAFKKSLTGTVFMVGAVSDANLRDVQKFDLVDRYPEAEAGSPVKDKQYYPLKALFAIDNTCREAFGFAPTGYEPQLCPRPVEPTRAPHEPPPPTGCQPPPGGCGGITWYPEPYCVCFE